MSYTYLQEQGEASLAECFSDIPACALSKSIRTAAKCCSNGNGTDCCHASQSGMTCEPSTGDRGEESQKSCAVASPAKTSVRREKATDSKEREADSGRKCGGWLAKYDRATSSWRTHQCSLQGEWESYSETWPRWGTMLNGECWERTMPVPHTCGTECGYWPTMSVTTTGGPTGLGGGSANKAKLKRMGCEKMATGWLNPTWSEWLMGWPMLWTSIEPQDSAASVTAKYQQWLALHGGLS